MTKSGQEPRALVPSALSSQPVPPVRKEAGWGPDRKWHQGANGRSATWTTEPDVRELEVKTVAAVDGF